MIASLARRFLPFAVLGLCATLFSPAAYGYDLENGSWPSGSVITMQMELGPLSQTLQDGSQSWNEAAAPAIDAWNAQMESVQLAKVMNSSRADFIRGRHQFRLLFRDSFRRCLRPRSPGGDLLLETGK